MIAKTVKELALPLGYYPVVNQEQTLVEALKILLDAEAKISHDLHRPRAVLVVDDEEEVVGKMGHLDFLKALEPKYSMLGDLDNLARAGISPDFIDSIMDNFSFLQGSLELICRKALPIKVKEVMRPGTESIDEEALLTEAIHKMVMWQSMRILVTRKGKAVGVLRLADLFEEVAANLLVAAGES